jgi:hypothetical protein
MSDDGRARLPRVLERLVDAVNSHELSSLVGCFAADYRNQTPVHPARGFRGRDQVHRNWTQLFAGVPDLRARVPRSVMDDSTAWTEWHMIGTRGDSTTFEMAGTVIFEVTDDLIQSATFYLEPVEETSGDVNTAIRRAVGAPPNRKETS